MVIEGLADFERALQAASARREAFHRDPALDCYRLFHGYSEGFPGISVDRYGACVILNKKAELPLADDQIAQVLRRVDGAREADGVTSIVMKTHQKIDESTPRRVRTLSGHLGVEPLKVKEDAAFYYADPTSLHTNGLYLDARPVRRWLRAHADGRRVLNLFAHTGSLGIAARLGGAREVVYLDKHQAALEKVLHSYSFNGLKPDDRGLLTGDLYYHLPRAIKWKQRFSGIILDPPPVVPPPPRVPSHRPEGQDFAALVSTCCKLLDDGAWLVCIYHDYEKDHDAHDQAIVAASDGRLRPTWRATADADFPESDANRQTRMSAFEFRR